MFWSWLFVIKYNYGVVGTGYAGVISNGSILIICLIYTSMLEDVKEGVFWPDSRSCTGIYEYLKVGIPSVVMIAAEWWAYEVIAILTGLFGVKV